MGRAIDGGLRGVNHLRLRTDIRASYRITKDRVRNHVEKIKTLGKEPTIGRVLRCEAEMMERNLISISYALLNSSVKCEVSTFEESLSEDKDYLPVRLFARVSYSLDTTEIEEIVGSLVQKGRDATISRLLQFERERTEDDVAGLTGAPCRVRVETQD